MQVFFHQFHIPGKTGLSLDQDQFELSGSGGFEHSVEVRPGAVDAGIILVTIYMCNFVAVLAGIFQQHGPLVLDAFGFLDFAAGQDFVLFAQAAVDGGSHGQV